MSSHPRIFFISKRKILISPAFRNSCPDRFIRMSDFSLFIARVV